MYSRKKIKQISLSITSILIILNFCLIIEVSSVAHPEHEITISAIDRTDWFWTEADLVSTGTTENSFHPIVRTDSEGNVHTMWFDSSELLESGSDYDIFYRMYNVHTETWLAIELVSSESIGSSQYPDFVIDSTGDIHAVWKDLSNFDGCGGDDDVFYKRKEAVTGTWSQTLVLSYFSTDISVGPSICVDSENRVHAVWFDFTTYLGSGSDGDIFYTNLEPVTQQWSTIEVVSTESTGNSFYPRIDSDSEDNIHVAWGDYSDYLGTGTDADIFYKRWIKALDYWTVTEVLSAHALNIDPSTEVDLEIADDGTVYVAWRDPSGFYGVGTDDDICLNTWNPISGTWSTAAIVSLYSGSGSYAPSLCVDYSGVLHCVWMDAQDYSSSGSDWDIWHRSYNPETSSWNTPFVLTDNIDYSGVPRIVTDDTGFLYMIIEDSSVMDGSEGDNDIFLYRMVTIPEAPTMFDILPNPTTDSLVCLNWTDVASAQKYQIYRFKGDLSSPTELVAHDLSSINSYTDIFEEKGKYYYAITAINEFGESELSNIKYVEVNISKTFNFFGSLAVNDIAILGGIVVAVQILFTTLLYFLLKGRLKTKKKQ